MTRGRAWIEPLLCTECVLFADAPRCQAACPVRAIVHGETEPSRYALHPLPRAKSRPKEVKNERKIPVS